VGGRKNLEQWLGLHNALTYDSAERVLRKWAPYAGLIYFHLLLERLEHLGYLNESR